MNLYVNNNLALELPSDLAPQLEAHDNNKSDPRAELAAQFIPAGAQVLDLSENATLQTLLPGGCSYRDANQGNKKRPARGCDLNTEFPTEVASQCDVIVMLGSLERVADIDNLFTHLRFCKRDIILSYCATDLAKDLDRAALGFTNHLSFYDLATLFDRYGFRIECTTPVDETQVLMRLTPTEWLAPTAPCSVAVISGDDGTSFGTRLGCHMINALLPGEADVHHLTLRTLNEARGNYDLVVVGTGGGLFPPLLGDELLDVISGARASIGIFGTQCRELVSRPAIDRVVERLDTWFARYEDDVLMYGRGRSNIVHIGDWLIDQFPLTRPVKDEPLVVNDELGKDFGLDRAIRTIQKYKQVYATVPTALLCALSSAELAAYAEIPVQQPDLTSGQFRSMLIDIFGRTYPEKKFFMVDRDAVIRYKARVHRNVAKVSARIGSILRNVAVAAA
jgi:hypothetical protein